MVQYWWVTQTRNHDFERKEGIVAGQINRENPKRTHYGRANVQKMNVHDFLVCYIRNVGIDRVARIMEKCPKFDPENPEKAPWPGSNKSAIAYIAKVKYYDPIETPIKEEEYITQMLNYGGYPKGPITCTGKINRGYAFKLDEGGFNILMSPRNVCV